MMFKPLNKYKLHLVFLLLSSMFSFSFSIFLSDELESTFTLSVTHIPQIEGNIAILVFDNQEGFPEKKEQAIFKTTVKVVSKTMEIDLGVLPCGEYAIAVIHDKNSNKELDRNILGLPKEAFGFSNTSKLTFGPPSFANASILFNDKNKHATIKLLELF